MPITTFRDPLLAQPFARWSAIVASTLNLAAWIVVLGIPNIPGPDAVVLHYTTTFGIDALGSWPNLFRLPLTGLALLAANLALARLFAKLEVGGGRLEVRGQLPHASTILLIASVVLEFAVLLGTVLLWQVNTE